MEGMNLEKGRAEMRLDGYTKEKLKETSLLELAYVLLAEDKQVISFKEMMDRLAKLLHLQQKEIHAQISQFYTDLNIDGRFICVGENRWGLRVWYPYDQVQEELPMASRTTKKKKSTVDDLDDFDDLGGTDFDFVSVDEEFEEDILEDDILDDGDEEFLDSELDNSDLEELEEEEEEEEDLTSI